MNLQLLTHSHLLSAAFWSWLYITQTSHKLSPTEDAPISLQPNHFTYRLRQEAPTEYLPPHTDFDKKRRSNTYYCHLQESTLTPHSANTHTWNLIKHLPRYVLQTLRPSWDRFSETQKLVWTIPLHSLLCSSF